MNEKQWTIGELADAAGVTVRTIRYYVKEGLLPAPHTQGRYALYNDSYLKRLELIRRWKDNYLPLKEIRVRIQPLSDQEVALLLQTIEQPEEPFEVKPRVMRSVAMPPETEAGETHPKKQARSKSKAAPENAASYARQLREGKLPEENSAADYAHKIREQRPHTPNYFRPRIRQQSEEWRRIRVMPGFELNLSEGVYRQYEAEIQELLDWVHQKFGSLRHRV